MKELVVTVFHVNMNKECVVIKVASMLSTHCSM